MKILITGSAGFIGYHLSKSFLEDGQEVLGVDNINSYYDKNLKIDRLENLKSYKNFQFKKVDISEKDSIKKVFEFFKPNKVVNLAAQAGVRYSIENPYAYMNSNLIGFLNIIELCRHNNVDGLVYASSSSVYGGNKEIPFSTDHRVDDPISLYAASKKSNELIANRVLYYEGLAKYFNSTSVDYLTQKNMEDTIHKYAPKMGLCGACFNGNYEDKLLNW